jgi:hypothetical protein
MTPASAASARSLVRGEKGTPGWAYCSDERGDESSRVARVIPKVSPKTHDDEVLKLLGELPAPA